MLDFLFRRKKNESVVSESLKVDLHSHVIPGIDDGAATDVHAIELIRGLQSLGYHKLITTPHIHHDLHKNTPQTISDGMKRLRKQLQQHQIAIEIEWAAEYFLDEFFLKEIESGSLLTFGKNYVLFELSFISKPPMLDEAIFRLNLAGYQPVLAHPERYSYFHDKRMIEYEKLKNAGVLFQLNIMSVAGHYGMGARTASHDLIEKGMIEFAGSDLHREKHIEVLQKAQKERDYETLLSQGKLLNNFL